MVLFNRKDGVVFTIIALVISSFILLLFFYMIELPVDHSVEVTRIKIHNINTFLSQSEDIVKAQAVASSKQTISSIISHMYSRNAFIPNFDDAFVNCLETGSHNWGGNVCSPNSNFKELIEDDLSSFLRDNTGLLVDFVVSDIVLNQSTPWALDINFRLDMNLREEGFSWDISMNVSESFSIIGFPDPMHAVVHGGVSSYRPALSEVSRIKVDEMYNNISGFKEKVSTLNILLKDKVFFEHNLAPSFHNRLRGNVNPSNLGIMTIILPIYTNPSDYNSVVRSGSSSMDWHFWQNRFDNSLSYGLYDFTDLEDMRLVLNVDDTINFNLTNTLHYVIIPRPLATQANVSNPSYFN